MALQPRERLLSASRSQCQPGYSDREIDSDTEFDGEWLQDDRPPRPADENVGAKARPERNMTACADIGTPHGRATDPRILG